MTSIKKWFYLLTAYIPRKLPGTAYEFEAMYRLMVDFYDVPDCPETRGLVAGHVTATPATRLRAPWGNFANAAKRIYINNVCGDIRKAIAASLHQQFSEKLQAEARAAEAQEKANEQEAQTQ